MTTSRFDDLTDVYEAMIDWPRRLAGDGPFFEELFFRHAVRRVADVACGTGHHAAMFHRWGLVVEGADIGPNMIDRARRNFGQPDGLAWSVRGFEQPFAGPEPWDAVTCLGNSLALAGDLPAAGQAVANVVRALRPGGLLVLQVQNAWRLPDGPCLWQKCLRIPLPQGESIVTKGVQRVGNRAFVHLVVAPLDAPEQFRSESVPFLALETGDLEALARQAGADRIQFYGDQKRGPYRRESSADILLVASKADGQGDGDRD
ncbi:MAG: class I SAM-dependent DNA methyltransferase [Thermoguttaceae bacterium]